MATTFGLTAKVRNTGKWLLQIAALPFHLEKKSSAKRLRSGMN